jgi:signal transduction histidine kinase
MVITDSDLGDLLRQLCDAFTGRTNVPIALTITGKGTLPTEVQVALYRLCQEGLNNIAKHARASQVTIKLHFETGLAELTIRDDGRGFDPAQIPLGHYGLNIMQERAEAIGALLSVTSQVGHGTEIKISWLNTAP